MVVEAVVMGLEIPVALVITNQRLSLSARAPGMVAVVRGDDFETFIHNPNVHELCDLNRNIVRAVNNALEHNLPDGTVCCEKARERQRDGLNESVAVNDLHVAIMD